MHVGWQNNHPVLNFSGVTHGIVVAQNHPESKPLNPRPGRIGLPFLCSLSDLRGGGYYSMSEQSD
jgi:hypothetical protein